MSLSNEELIFAVIENDKVVNVIVAYDLQFVTDLFPNNEIVQVLNNELAMDYFRENNKWYPPKLDPDFIWHEETGCWLLQEEIDNYEIGKNKPSTSDLTTDV